MKKKKRLKNKKNITRKEFCDANKYAFGTFIEASSKLFGPYVRFDAVMLYNKLKIVSDAVKIISDAFEPYEIKSDGIINLNVISDQRTIKNVVFNNIYISTKKLNQKLSECMRDFKVLYVEEVDKKQSEEAKKFIRKHLSLYNNFVKKFTSLLNYFEIFSNELSNLIKKHNIEENEK